MPTSIDTCGCCEGIAPLTPESVANRPGLSALAYRVGTHASFLESMLARLSSHGLVSDAESGGAPAATGHPLRDLGTREPDDPSIALLDAWATVADVLTFYQERIANEGFLRTAEQRRSILELARLVGYRLRPGVAASTWLALEVDKGYRLDLKPHDVKAQSVPGPDETAETFENIEPIEARADWNQLKPRLTRPQTWNNIVSGEGLTPVRPRLYVKGVTTDLKHNDVLLVTEGPDTRELFRVELVVKDAAADRTLVTFQEAARTPVSRLAQMNVSEIDRIIEQFCSDKALQDFRVSGTDTAARVVNRVKEMQRAARRKYSCIEAAALALQEPIAALKSERTNAVTRNYENLGPWLEEFATALESATAPLRAAVERERTARDSPSTSIFKAELPSSFIAKLTQAPSIAPRSPQSIKQDLTRSVANRQADAGLQLAGSFTLTLGTILAQALSAIPVAPASPLRAHVFRATARPFGHNAPLRPVLWGSENNKITSYFEWELNDPLGRSLPDAGMRLRLMLNSNGSMDSVEESDESETTGPAFHPQHDPHTLYLDGEYKLGKDGWVVVERSHQSPLFLDLAGNDLEEVSQGSMSAYGISGKSTRIVTSQANGNDWFDDATEPSFAPVRQTLVHCESEELELAEEPIVEPIPDVSTKDWIELDGLYSGLKSGRWLVVSGERADVLDQNSTPVPGIEGNELIMISGVEHRYLTSTQPRQQNSDTDGEAEALPGESTHTFIHLAEPLAYTYRRDSVTLYGNLVKASHGETRTETLGAGDAAKAFQSFALKQNPVTYVAAPTPAGTESSLEVYVNDVRWHEKLDLTDLGPADRGFITKTGDAGKTTVVFGDGITGARLPTGMENVRAIYRRGIGKAGNVETQQISQLAVRPLGLKGVVNPLPATGGADREDRDTARQNAPRTITALDRLVSVSDYADFARTFAGIAKAEAAVISDGRRQWVHVTIAGADDIPIDEGSDLFRNLRKALVDFGEPGRALALQVREALLLVIGAKVRILPDYLWEKVADSVRAKLLNTFSFARRALGQDVTASEVIAAIQSVEGVAWVDLDILGGLPEKKTDISAHSRPERRVLTPSELAAEAQTLITASASVAARLAPVRANHAGFEDGAMRPAQVAYLTPRVPDTLALNQVKDASIDG